VNLAGDEQQEKRAGVARHRRGANIHLLNNQNISLEKMPLDEDIGKFCEHYY
jgi:hypothetical protein